MSEVVHVEKLDSPIRVGTRSRRVGSAKPTEAILVIRFTKGGLGLTVQTWGIDKWKE